MNTRDCQVVGYINHPSAGKYTVINTTKVPIESDYIVVNKEPPVYQVYLKTGNNIVSGAIFDTILLPGSQFVILYYSQTEPGQYLALTTEDHKLLVTEEHKITVVQPNKLASRYLYHLEYTPTITVGLLYGDVVRISSVAGDKHDIKLLPGPGNNKQLGTNVNYGDSIFLAQTAIVNSTGISAAIIAPVTGINYQADATYQANSNTWYIVIIAITIILVIAIILTITLLS